jgi:hypothetical protein
MWHDLKTWPAEFAAVEAGVKRFEWRKNDRGFEVGDVLRLQEYDPDREQHTHRETVVDVTYLLRGPLFGVPEGYVVMSIRRRLPFWARLRAFLLSGW